MVRARVRSGLVVLAAVAVILATMVLAAGPVEASEPKGCTHMVIYVTVLGNRIDAPTNDNCLGPSNWEDSFKVQQNVGDPGLVQVGVGIWISEPF